MRLLEQLSIGKAGKGLARGEALRRVPEKIA